MTEEIIDCFLVVFFENMSVKNRGTLEGNQVSKRPVVRVIQAVSKWQPNTGTDSNIKEDNKVKTEKKG